MSRLTDKFFAWNCVTLPLALLLGALGVQHFLGWEPCTICVEIRAALTLCTLAGLVLWAGLKWRSLLVESLARLVLLCGACTAFYLNIKLVLLEHHVFESFSCSPFPFYFNILPLQDWLPYVFMSGGVCGENTNTILGVSFTTWTAVALFFFWAFVIKGLLRLALRLA